MKLADLEPKFLGGQDKDGSWRAGVGVRLNCPCGCASELYVPFANPLDGGEQFGTQGWNREGSTIETLSLTPSILRLRVGDEPGCGWHGFITKGEVISV